MDVRKYLYDSVRHFMLTTDFSGLSTMNQYYLLWHFRMQFDKLGAEQTEENRAELYVVNLNFNLYVMQRIQQVVACCAPSKLLALTEQEIVDWFFTFEVPIGEPYQQQV